MQKTGETQPIAKCTKCGSLKPIKDDVPTCCGRQMEPRR